MKRKNTGHKCLAKGCGRPAQSRGYCGMHYMRWAKHGSPDIVKPRGYPVDPKKVSDIRMLRRQGYTMQQIGDRYGVSKQCVSAFCRKYGIQARYERTR